MQSEGSKRDVATAVREPRPFLYLKPAALPVIGHDVDGVGLARLSACVEPSVPQLVRSIVDYTIASQNARTRRAQPIKMSVLNRRRRAVRSWLRAIAEGRVDGGTRHAVATQWLPILCGTGPDLALANRPARELVEFVRGALTACVFSEPRPNLIGDARALHALEATLSVHLAAAREAMSASAADAAAEAAPVAGGLRR